MKKIILLPLFCLLFTLGCVDESNVYPSSQLKRANSAENIFLGFSYNISKTEYNFMVSELIKDNTLFLNVTNNVCYVLKLKELDEILSDTLKLIPHFENDKLCYVSLNMQKELDCKNCVKHLYQNHEDSDLVESALHNGSLAENNLILNENNYYTAKVEGGIDSIKYRLTKGLYVEKYSKYKPIDFYLDFDSVKHKLVYRANELKKNNLISSWQRGKKVTTFWEGDIVPKYLYSTRFKYTGSESKTRLKHIGDNHTNVKIIYTSIEYVNKLKENLAKQQEMLEEDNEFESVKSQI